MTYRKYTGRGLDWRKRALTKREAKRIARYEAGLIIDAAVSDGWRPDYLIGKFSEEGVDMIADALLDVALWLRDTGSHDGRSTR